MPAFQVSSKSVQSTAPPKKRARRFPPQWYVIVRFLIGGSIAGLIFGFLVTRFTQQTHDAVFILLPVLLSLATAQFRDYNLSALFNGSVSSLRATGMPLGLMPDSSYEEHEVTIAPGESILFYSDGLVEAHNSKRDMFDSPRLKAVLAKHAGGPSLIDTLLKELRCFTGEGWEQEDDVTLVTLQRTAGDFPEVGKTM